MCNIPSCCGCSGRRPRGTDPSKTATRTSGRTERRSAPSHRPRNKNFPRFLFHRRKKKLFRSSFFYFSAKKSSSFGFFFKSRFSKMWTKKFATVFFLLSSSLQSRWRRDTGEEKMIRARNADPVSSTIEKKPGSKKLWRKKTKKKNQSEAFLVTNKGEPKWATREERKVHCSSLFQKDAAH